METIVKKKNWKVVNAHGNLGLYTNCYSSKYGGPLRDTEKDISDGRFPKYAVDMYNKAKIALGYVEDDPMYCQKCGVVTEELDEENDYCPHCKKK